MKSQPKENLLNETIRKTHIPVFVELINAVVFGRDSFLALNTYITRKTWFSKLIK